MDAGDPGSGEVSEWLKEHAWKVCKRLNRASGVRIPLSPPVAGIKRRRTQCLWWPRRPLATLGRKLRQGRKAATVSIDAGAEVSWRGHRLFHAAHGKPTISAQMVGPGCMPPNPAPSRRPLTRGACLASEIESHWTPAFAGMTILDGFLLPRGSRFARDSWFAAMTIPDGSIPLCSGMIAPCTAGQNTPRPDSPHASGCSHPASPSA